MRVLVVAEGQHEQSGALENLLKRLGGEGADFETDRVSNRRIHAWHGPGDLDVLSERCPSGFAPFASDVGRIFA